MSLRKTATQGKDRGNSTIRTGGGIPNTDGMDLDSCDGASIRDCDITSGDDAFCMKATSSLPCRNIFASGCKLSTGNNGVKPGTESIGDFENTRVSDCQISHAGMCGIAIYGVDGGQIHDVSISNVTIENTSVAVGIRLGAPLKTFRPGEVPRQVGIIRDIAVRNLTATHIHMVGMLINGIPDHPIENITFENVHLELPGGGTAKDAKVQLAEKTNTYPEFNMFGNVIPAAGFYIRHVSGMTFKDIKVTTVKPDQRPMAVLIDATGSFPYAFTARP